MIPFFPRKMTGDRPRHWSCGMADDEVWRGILGSCAAYAAYNGISHRVPDANGLVFDWQLWCHREWLTVQAARRRLDSIC